MKNVKDLVDKLTDLMAKVEAGSIDYKTADLLQNIAGKITSAHAVQVKYYAMQKTKPRIGFLSTRGNSDEQV